MKNEKEITAQDFIEIFELAYNKESVSDKFSHDAGVPFEFNTSLYVNDDSETVVFLVEKHDNVVSLSFDQGGVTFAEFDFNPNNMHPVSLIAIISGLIG